MDWRKPCKEVDTLDSEITDAALQRMGIEPDEATEEHFERISKMSARELFDEYLIWNGIIGFTGQFIAVIKSLEEAQS